jgi:hypothetical protein
MSPPPSTLCPRCSVRERELRAARVHRGTRGGGGRGIRTFTRGSYCTDCRRAYQRKTPIGDDAFLQLLRATGREYS